MGIRTVTFSLSLLCFCSSFSTAAPVSIAADASFTGGLYGSWSFQYTSGAPDLLLESITLDLSPTDLRFDTAAGGFGSGSFKNIGGFGGTGAATGLAGISATGSALDGGTFVTFNFSNFLPGSSFRFSSDVDHANPTLLSLQNCAGITGPAQTACLATNAARTVTNDGRLLAAQTVGANQMAGALMSFQFAGPDDGSERFTGAFQRVTWRDDDREGSEGDDDFHTTANIANPEPASLATLGAGLGLLIALANRRRA